MDGGKALASALDSQTLLLRELNLQNNRAIDNAAAVAFMRAIEHNQHLTKLWLSGTQVQIPFELCVEWATGVHKEVTAAKTFDVAVVVMLMSGFWSGLDLIDGTCEALASLGACSG